MSPINDRIFIGADGKPVFLGAIDFIPYTTLGADREAIRKSIHARLIAEAPWLLSPSKARRVIRRIIDEELS